jgi:hypothetical protein
MKQAKLYNAKEKNNYLDNIFSFPFFNLLIAVLFLLPAKNQKMKRLKHNLNQLII